MLEGQLSGRITSVSGMSGFTPYFRLPVDLTYQYQPSTPILDVVNPTPTSTRTTSHYSRTRQAVRCIADVEIGV